MRIDVSTRTLPRWFIAALFVCLSARLIVCLIPVPQPPVLPVAWTQGALTVDAQKPLFLYLENETAQPARDARRLFSDPAIVSLLNSSFTPRRVDSTDVIALALMGPEVMKLKRQSAIIVFGKDGKPASPVATFIPRRSLLQLLRHVKAQEPAAK